MAQIPNNTNINDIIKSSIKNLKDTTKVLKVIIGEIEDISKIIPADFDQYSAKLDSVSKLMSNYLGIIQKIPSLSKIDKTELKSSSSMVAMANDYYKNFIELMDNLNDLSYSANYKSLTEFTGIVDKLTDSISSISNMPNFNIRQLLRTKLYLVEYEWILNEILVIHDKMYKDFDVMDTSNISDSINNLYNVINTIDEGDYSTLVSAPFKAALIQTAIIDILSAIKIVNNKLASKTLVKNMDVAENVSKSLIEVTNSLLEITDNLSQISKQHKSVNAAKNTLALLPPIFDLINKISKSIKDINIDNSDVQNVVNFTKRIIRIEKQVILMGLLAVPFAAASILSLVFITIGMLAMRALMHIILLISNPIVIRAVAMSIRRLAGVVLMIALTIASLALTVAVILIAHEMITNNLRQILETILCIGLVLLAVIGLGWLMTISSPLILAAVAGMTFVGLTLLAIIGISLVLKEIPKYGFDEKQQSAIKGAINSIISTVRSVVDSIFGAFDKPMGQKGEDGLVLSVSSMILGDTFTNIIKLVMASSILVFSTLAVGLVYLTSMTLNLLTTNSTIRTTVNNKQSIKSNVSTIMDTSKNVINSIFESFDSPISDQHDGVLVGLSSWLLGDTFTNMAKLILACAALTFTTIAVGLVKLTAMSLNMISNIKFDPFAVTSNTQTIMSTAKSIIAAVNAPVDPIQSGEKSFGRDIVEWIMPSGLLNMVDAIMSIGSLVPTMIAVGSVRFLAESLNTISKVTINTDVEKKAQDIVIMGSKLVKLINDQDSFGIIDNTKAIARISILKDLGNVLASFSKDIKVQNHEKIMDSTIKLVDKINTTKLENLRTAYNMFKEMKEFSQTISGNFEGLADALNEKIAPLLEELKELMSKIPEAVDKSASTVSGSVHSAVAWQSGTATQSQVAEQVARENPGMTKEEINKVVDQRMVEQTQTVNKGIEMKLEELMEILQNYSNPVPVRLT